MSFSQRLIITARIALYALSPPRLKNVLPPIPASPSTSPTKVSPWELRWALADLTQHIKADGTLAIFFPGCLALAAPFLLYRLKRRGFSSCRAAAAPEGLRLTATR